MSISPISKYWISGLSLWLLLIGLVAGTDTPHKLSASRLEAEGDAALQNREYEKALKYYNELIELEPNKHVNWHKRAMAHLAKNNYYKAISDWEKSIELEILFVDGYYYRGKTYQKIGECGKAHSDYYKVYNLNPSYENINVLITETETCVIKYEKVMKYLEDEYKKDCVLAQPLMEELLIISPFDNKLNFGMSECYFDNKDYQSVLKYTGNILRADPQNLNTLLLRGKSYYYLGEYDMAIKHYKSGLKSDPDHKLLKFEFKKTKKIISLINDGNNNLQNRLYNEAMDNFNEILKLDENNNIIKPQIYEKLCESSIKNRKTTFEERIELCTKNIEYNPDHGNGYYWRGQAYELNKDLENAERDYHNAINKDRNNHDYIQKLQNIQILQKKAKRKDYYKILQINEHASERDIKKAFRKCGLEHHPDKVKDLSNQEQKIHEDIFKDCVEAQEILTNPELRQKYDNGQDVLEQMQGGNRQQQHAHGFPFSFFSQGFSQTQGRTFTFRFNG